MKAFFSLETTTLLLVMVVIAGVVIGIAWVVNDGTPASRIGLTAVASVAWTAVTALWKIPAFRVLLRTLHRRFGGPTYVIEAGGVVWPGIAAADDTQLLNMGLSVAKRMHKKAQPDATFDNRMLIQGDRSRSIRLDVQRETADDVWSDDFDESSEPQLSFLMRGYTGNMARTKKMLDREIGPFMNRLVDEAEAKRKGRNFWLRITMEQGQNPLLRFYLRDVPTAQVDSFQLNLTDRSGDEPVRVVVRGDGFSISTRTVDGLTNSAKTYLSSLALPDTDRD